MNETFAALIPVQHYAALLTVQHYATQLVFLLDGKYIGKYQAGLCTVTESLSAHNRMILDREIANWKDGLESA